MFSTRVFTTALTAGVFASKALAFGVIFPLYIYPGDGCSGWSTVSSAISSHSDLDFFVIINPDSGPGSGLPDANYQACIPTLRASTNANRVIHVLGYDHTSFGARSTSDVVADLDAYASWGSTYRPDGIFFDEVATASSEISYYQTITTDARDNFDFVIFNPGTAPASGYFNIADLVVTIENAFSAFNVNQLVIGSSTPASKQAVILYGGPATPSTSLINQLASLGLKAIFMTDVTLAENPYGSLPSQWSTFVADVDAAS